MLRSLFFEANSGHQCRYIMKGPGKMRFGEGWWYFSLWLPQAWFNPEGKGRDVKTSLCVALQVLLNSDLAALPLGRTRQSLEPVLAVLMAEILGSWKHSLKADAILKGEAPQAAEVNKWIDDRKRKLCKETFLLWQKSSLMILDIALRCQWNPPDNFLASLLEPGGDQWAQTFCTFFPEDLINSSWICRNPEDFLQGSNLLEHKNLQTPGVSDSCIIISLFFCEARNKREIFCVVCVSSIHCTFMSLSYWKLLFPFYALILHIAIAGVYLWLQQVQI